MAVDEGGAGTDEGDEVGCAEGRSRFKEVPTGHEAFALAMLCRRESSEDDWKDISLLISNTPFCSLAGPAC